MVFFPVKSQYLPEDTAVQVLSYSSLIFTRRGFYSREITVATEPFASTEDDVKVLEIWDVLRQDSSLITAWNKIHPRWKCPLLELKSSQNAFSFPFVFEAKQLLFFFFFF